MEQKYLEYVPSVLLVFQDIEEAIRQYVLRCEVILLPGYMVLQSTEFPIKELTGYLSYV